MSQKLHVSTAILTFKAVGQRFRSDRILLEFADAVSKTIVLWRGLHDFNSDKRRIKDQILALVLETEDLRSVSMLETERLPTNEMSFAILESVALLKTASSFKSTVNWTFETALSVLLDLSYCCMTGAQIRLGEIQGSLRNLTKGTKWFKATYELLCELGDDGVEDFYGQKLLELLASMR